MRNQRMMKNLQLVRILNGVLGVGCDTGGVSQLSGILEDDQEELNFESTRNMIGCFRGYDSTYVL